MNEKYNDTDEQVTGVFSDNKKRKEAEKILNDARKAEELVR